MLLLYQEKMVSAWDCRYLAKKDDNPSKIKRATVKFSIIT